MWIKIQELFCKLFIQPFCKHDYGIENDNYEGVTKEGKKIYICSKCNKCIDCLLYTSDAADEL